jgi:phospholipid/cholesterol/gamma-HCH transport system substrate-binding protein
MQSRAVREGSVGLMLIAGLGVFGAIFLWLKGLTPGNQTYNVIAQFEQAPGVQPGGVVRYRGIRVGKIAKIEPGVNGVAVTMQMDDPNLIIPKDVAVEISQTGLIGEPVVEITPRTNAVINTSAIAKALDSKCDRNLILCNNTKVDGQIGASFNELLRRATKLVELYNNPEVVKNINTTLIKAGNAADDVSKLSKSVKQLSGEFSRLPKSVESGLNNLSAKADILTISLDRTSSKIGVTADKFNTTAGKFSITADQLNTTAVEYKKLAMSVNGLVSENRKTFASSLSNFDKLSVDLRKTVNELNPAIVKLNSTLSKVNSDKLAKDLESTLSNANQTSINLRNVSANLNDPKTILMLQQTLDSARTTFQNTQKITSDLDDITGNAEFRSNLRNLVNGLGKLVSSTEQLEQQAKLAQSIEPLGKSLSYMTKLPGAKPPRISLGKTPIRPVIINRDQPSPLPLPLPQPPSNLGEPTMIAPDPNNNLPPLDTPQP